MKSQLIGAKRKKGSKWRGKGSGNLHFGCSLEDVTATIAFYIYRKQNKHEPQTVCFLTWETAGVGKPISEAFTEFIAFVEFIAFDDFLKSTQ
jgi:hypothetical protein